MQRSVLIVEDDPELGELLRTYLTGQGFAVRVLRDGHVAVDAILETTPDLVILDQMLPGLSGVEVCQRVRRNVSVPILMLTAVRGDIDIVAGLEAGVDDYVVKPCTPRVLLARIRALLRRTDDSPGGDATAPEETVQVGSLIVNRSRRQVLVCGRDVGATSAELEIAWALAANAGTVVTRNRLSLEARGIPFDGVDRGIDIHVSRVRRKLADAGLQDLAILAVRGEGYQLVRVDP